MKRIKILALVLAAVMVLASFAGCGKKKQAIDLADAVEHADYTSVYEKIGSKVTIDMVKEDDEGFATVEVDGTTYTLGMDFLSMAMVYNTTVPEGSSKYKTSEDVYNEWWKLYIQRWNYLAPEVPLYSNQYFDIYNAKIQNFKTSPYWGPEDAIVSASVKEGEANSVILGSSTDLSGAFRNASWGKSSPGSSDLDIQDLTTGYSIVMSGFDGSYNWNMSAVVEEPTSKINDDGTLTYTIKIKEGLKFSDGSEITAKNYIAGTLANSTAVSVAAGGSGTSGLQLKGYKEFKAYEGGEVAEGASRYFSGVQLIDDYTFAVTYGADYANYYYTIALAAYSPNPLALYLGDADIIVNENNECGLSDSFYEKTTKDGTEVYKNAEVIKNNLEWNSALPYSGPYTVSNYNASTKTATLKLNPEYLGDDARGKASIETITYIKIVSETQTDMFKNGEVDVLAGITGGDETKAALKLVSDNPEKFAETHYDRAGYGKIGFRADFGPTSMVEVRQAIMYTINRPEFAQTFTGGYGSVVDGPYYEGFSAFQAVKNEIKLNKYTYSSDSAIKVLEDAGWIYNKKGNEFVAGKDTVRYKKLSGYELSKENLAFKTTDGKYSTIKLDGEYYMPLAINYFGTQPNSVTDQLITAWQANPASTTAIGMYIVYTSTDFTTGLFGELVRMESYGYDGTPKVNAINFASGFTTSTYDYAYNWTIDPELYDDYSACYVKDEADFFENYAK